METKENANADNGVSQDQGGGAAPGAVNTQDAGQAQDAGGEAGTDRAGGEGAAAGDGSGGSEGAAADNAGAGSPGAAVDAVKKPDPPANILALMAKARAELTQEERDELLAFKLGVTKEQVAGSSAILGSVRQVRGDDLAAEEGRKAMAAGGGVVVEYAGTRKAVHATRLSPHGWRDTVVIIETQGDGSSKEIAPDDYTPEDVAALNRAIGVVATVRDDDRDAGVEQ